MSKLVGEQGMPMNALHLRNHYNVPISQIYGTWWLCPEGWRKAHLAIFASTSTELNTNRGSQIESPSDRAQASVSDLGSVVNMVDADKRVCGIGSEINQESNPLYFGN
jgi:hypothetical protein